jgi:hypothetical protein
MVLIVVVGVGALARGDRWLAAALGVAIGIRVVLWLLSPYASWAKEAIDPGPKTLERMNRQADALEQSRIPGLGRLSRFANRGQWWRDRKGRS